MTNNNEFPGFKISPFDLIGAFADVLAAEAEPAKRKEPDFDIKSHFDNLAAKGQELFGGLGFPGIFDERNDDKGAAAGAVPVVDVLVRPSGVKFLVGAPGVSQENVEVELEDTKLTISIHTSEIAHLVNSAEPTNNWKGGDWSQSFTIPTGDAENAKKIDEQNIAATVENGLIIVFVPYQAPKVTKVKVV